MTLPHHYLYINVRRYVNVADLVRQLESLADLRITATAFWRWGSLKTLHFNNAKAAFANVDKSLFDVSFKLQRQTFIWHIHIIHNQILQDSRNQTFPNLFNLVWWIKTQISDFF